MGGLLFGNGNSSNNINNSMSDMNSIGGGSAVPSTTTNIGAVGS